MWTQRFRIAALAAVIIAAFALILPACSEIAPAPAPSPAPAPAPSGTPSPVITPSPSPTTAPVATVAPLPVPKATTQPTTGPIYELRMFALGLINKDRQKEGLAALTLGDNAAAQKHADDILANYYLSHWGTDGLKPYMRYTQEGGMNFETENSAYSGWVNRVEDASPHPPMDAKTEIDTLEYKMMNEDAASNWGHRLAILNKFSKKVSIGIAHDKYRLALVQQFEGDYVQFSSLPTLTGNILSLNGKISLGKIETFALFYDPLPQPKTAKELMSGPRSYGLGERVGHLMPPPPPGQYYSSLSPGAIIASKWELDASGTTFSVQADVSPAMTSGKGVYTVVIWVKTDTEQRGLTNYSFFVK